MMLKEERVKNSITNDMVIKSHFGQNIAEDPWTYARRHTVYKLDHLVTFLHCICTHIPWFWASV